MHTCTSSLLGAVLVSLVLMMEYEGDVACLPRMSLPVLTGRGRGCWCGGAGRRAGGGPDPGASGRVSAGEGPRRLGRAGATRQRARGGGAASAGAARLPAGGGWRPLPTPSNGHAAGAAWPLQGGGGTAAGEVVGRLLAAPDGGTPWLPLGFTHLPDVRWRYHTIVAADKQFHMARLLRLWAPRWRRSAARSKAPVAAMLRRGEGLRTWEWTAHPRCTMQRVGYATRG